MSAVPEQYIERNGTTELCALCTFAVQRHSPGTFADCLAGARRMADARAFAGRPLTDLDRRVLAEPEEQP